MDFLFHLLIQQLVIVLQALSFYKEKTYTFRQNFCLRSEGVASAKTTAIFEVGVHMC